jgi:hypothetical protein
MLTIVTPAAESDLLAVARVKTELSISGSSEDATLELLIAEASALLAAYCGRDTFGRETLLQTERLTCATESIVLGRDIAPAITSVTVDGETLDTDEYEIDSSLLYRLEDDQRTWWDAGKVVVSFQAGFSLPNSAPTALARAALDLVVGMYRGAGRDTTVRQEMVEGVGATSYFDVRAGAGTLPLSADRLRALDRYRLVVVA